MNRENALIGVDRLNGSSATRSRRAAVLCLAAATLVAAQARAATPTNQYWDPNGSLTGNGTWDLTTNDWSNASTGGSPVISWVNGNAALFAGTAGGTVTVDPNAGVTTSGMSFGVAGYTVAGGPLTLLANSGVAPVISSTFSGTGTTTISAALAGSGGVTFSGSSYTDTFVLGSANTYSGITTIQKSTVSFSTLAATGSNSSFGTSGTVALGGQSSAASLTYTGTGGSTDRLFALAAGGSLSVSNNGTGAINFNNTGAATSGLASAPTSTNTLTFTGTATTASTFGETLGDFSSSTALAVIKSGSATWTLSGNNTYTGGTTLSAGTLGITQASSLGTGTLNITGSAVLSASAALNVSNAITGSGSGTETFANTATSGNVFQLSGLISGIENVKLASTSGTTALSDDANNFTGALGTGYGTFTFTSVANGGSASSLGAATSAYAIGNGSSFVTFRYVGAGPSSTNRAIDWQGTSGTLALDASGGGAVSFLNTTTNVRSAAGAATLELTGSNTGSNTLAQVINDSTNGATAVSKVGAGKWVLTGADTYTGGTAITGGTLVAGSATSSLGSGSTTVTGTGVLAGTGVTGGGVTVGNGTPAGGTITAGTGATKSDSAGTLTLSGLTLAGGGSYAWKVQSAVAGAVAGTNYDLLKLTSLNITATAASPFTLSLVSASDAGFVNGKTYTIAYASAGITNFNAADFVLNTANLSGGYSSSEFAVSTAADGGSGADLDVTFTEAAPEPASVVLFGGAAGSLLVTRRRRAFARREIPC